MKKNSILSKALFGMLVLTASLLAADSEDQSESQRVMMSHVEKVQIQERRALIAQKLENGEDLSDMEDLELSEAEKLEIAEAKGEGESEGLAPFRHIDHSAALPGYVAPAAYYSSHQGAYYHPILVTPLGDSVELDDGSIWLVCSNDRFKTLDWFSGDVIVITPNSSWFSMYNYRLNNTNTGASVKVNLLQKPIWNGIYTHTIITIDYFNREICLEDGSVWKISCLDAACMNQWLPNHTIIMGINDGWFSGSNPNILINATLDNYVIAECIYSVAPIVEWNIHFSLDQ